MRKLLMFALVLMLSLVLNTAVFGAGTTTDGTATTPGTTRGMNMPTGTYNGTTTTGTTPGTTTPGTTGTTTPGMYGPNGTTTYGTRGYDNIRGYGNTVDGTNTLGNRGYRATATNNGSNWGWLGLLGLIGLAGLFTGDRRRAE